MDQSQGDDPSSSALSNPPTQSPDQDQPPPVTGPPPQDTAEEADSIPKQPQDLDPVAADPDPEPDPEPVAVVKRKRGRPPKSQAKKQPQPPKKKENDEEVVCFICFDGGSLVCCDRRGCSKVYHAACVNRDEAFFKTKGKWNCGWHICSICEKAAHYMCYTCTYSLCKVCIKETRFICVRGKKGFCETCYGTVMMIESNEQASEAKVGINFDDKNSFECLFKHYWFDVKRRLSLTIDELENANVPPKGSSAHTHKVDSSSDELYNANDEQEASSDSSSGCFEGSTSSRKKPRRRSRTRIAAEESSAIQQVDNVGTSSPENTEWASQELLEFVAFMKGGDRSVLSQFDVQALLLEYIKQNNLRDPRRKSQIVCDSRLESLFGKSRVGHFEMLKLIESHFLIKEAPKVVTDINQIDPDSGEMDADGYADGTPKGYPDKRRKNRKKFEEREPQTNFDEYAAIDVHNIGLIYLKRNLMEDLLEDVAFTEKVIGSFVRIRIPSTGQKQDIYRLVQVVGTSKAVERYKTGRKTTYFLLEILNLDKKEIITIDTLSNQDFTEEECKRLRQSIKFGLISRLTVGDIYEKARVLQAVRVSDWLESEKQRLCHLRDRASETGRRKELRECVEKLQLLSTPEERARRLNEVPEVHSDPKMDPDYGSVDEEEFDSINEHAVSIPRDSHQRKAKDLLSTGRGPPASSNWAGGQKGSNSSWDSSRNGRTEGGRDRLQTVNAATDRTNEPSWNHEKGVLQTNKWELETGPSDAIGQGAAVWNKNLLTTAATGQSHGETVATSDVATETEKIWHYKDPAGKVQGPFSMSQLRKWNTTGYFPADLRIWCVSENPEDSVLLTDALVGRFEKDLPQWEPPRNKYSHPTTFATGVESHANGNEHGSGWRESTRGTWNGTLSRGQQNADGWGSQPPTGPTPKMEVFNPVPSPTVANPASGQPLVYGDPRPVTPFYGSPYGPPPYQGNGARGVGRPWDDQRGDWSSGIPRPFQAASQGYARQPATWGSSNQQSSRNHLANGLSAQPSHIPQPTGYAGVAGQGASNIGVQPVGIIWGSANSVSASTGAGWGAANMPQPDVTPRQPIDTGWGTTPAPGPNAGLQPAVASLGQNRAAPAATPVGGAGGWGGANTSQSLWGQQPVALNVMGNHSAVLPRNEVISSSNPAGQGNTGPNKLNTAVSKNQFFDGGCPSPTPSNERQDLPAVQLNEPVDGERWSEANERPGSDPASVSTARGAPSSVLQPEAALQSSSLAQSDPQDNLSPIRDTQTRPALPVQDLSGGGSGQTQRSQQDQSLQKPELVQVNALGGPGDKLRGDAWSLPSPTPANKLSSWNDGAVSPSVKAQNILQVNQAQGNSFLEQPQSGWSISNKSPSAGWQAAPQDANMGTVRPTNVAAAWGTTPQGSGSGNMVTASPALGNANPSCGWGTWQEHLNMPDDENTSVSGWGKAPQEESSKSSAVWGTPNQNCGWGTGVTAATVEGGSQLGWGTPSQGSGRASGHEETNDWGAQQNQGVDQLRGGGGRGRDSSGYDRRYGAGGGLGQDSRYGGGGDLRRHESIYGGERRHHDDRAYRDRDRGGRSPSRREGRSQGICKFHESGYCKKGASCNYVHS